MDKLEALALKATQLNEGQVFLKLMNNPEAQAIIEELIITEQLSKGKRGDGTTLPNYSKRSFEVFGKPEGAIKLFDTGEFYKSIGVNQVTPDYFTTDADPIKIDDKGQTNLFDRYGESIKDLGKEGLAIFNQRVIDLLSDEIRKELGLN